jgi:[ribosomal protein S18]-alanine N-acetyltransferase
MTTRIPPAPGVRLCPMTPEWIEQVLALEKIAYSHPWTQGHFLDSLRSGYWAQVLLDPTGSLIGHLVAMPGVLETHLLNLTVAPEQQGQGWGRHLLDQLVDWSRSQSATTIWLEVRASNTRARRLYVAYGFEHVGERKHYYPGLGRQREHAVVMRLGVTPLA